jgi:hypothetical protein
MTKFKKSQEVSPLLSILGMTSDWMRLFAKVKAVHEKASLNLNPEQTFIGRKYKSFLEMEPILRKTKPNFVKLTKNYQRQVYSLAKMY